MRSYIKDLKDKQKVDQKFLIFHVNRGVTNKGAPYLSFNLQDKSGNIDAKYWSVKPEELDVYKEGMIIEAHGDILLYNNALQLRIASLEIVDKKQENIMEYVKSSKVSEKELKEEIYGIVDELQDPVYKDIVETILLENEKEFFTYPAARSIHHDFVGGLATHVLYMLRMGKEICHLYPFLNQDLLLSAIILHDIGKLEELSGPIITEYTLEGKLIGHISLMHAKVSETAIRLGYENDERVTLLRHMILSHHGEYEYGSPVLPQIPEAEILSLVDNIDARMNVLDKALSQVEEGEFTPKLFSLENRYFYKAKKHEK